MHEPPTQSLWPDATGPGGFAGPDDPVELGVKFRSDTAGFITGIRFYKSVLDTGTHVGNLWSSGGQPLASATFTGETDSGWQQVTFPEPVAITADTIYVASYHLPNGHYAISLGYFDGHGVDRAPLHAPASGLVGPNGLFAYGPTSSFPTGSFAASNYWVDVVFSSTLPDQP
jgi:hypothetical protein